MRHLFQPLQGIKALKKYDGIFSANTIQILRCLTTSAYLNKRTPHTVGTMSWVRAARRRKYLEQQMRDTEKNDHQILREEQLSRTVPEIEFRLPAYVKREIDESTMKKLHFKPEVFLSHDRKTIICYHPPPRSYPFNYTKPAVGFDINAIDKKVLDTFRDSITDEEITEGVKLREENPRTWDDKNLSKLFKIKPSVIALNIPLTNEQKERVLAEKDLNESMSQMKRRKLRELQDWERVRYVRKTRGAEQANFFKSLGRRGKPKTLVPPKF